MKIEAWERRGQGKCSGRDVEMCIQRLRVFDKKEVGRENGKQEEKELMASSSPVVSQVLPVVQVLPPVN